ncbi:MAG: DUF1810 domain-containing protein [Oscillospiraceae bacterium]|nr:DUF1810 domain-containing protein [Oscillospiraceae bacterium]
MSGFDLKRFADAQKRFYETAREEIRRGRKRSHWMWYIFPQIRGLGFSSNAHYYGIVSLEEARAYLADPYLGGNLCEISGLLLQLETSDPYRVFGTPDDMKLCSSMTLFALVSEEGSVFHKVLDKYYGGRMDSATLRILGMK